MAWVIVDDEGDPINSTVTGNRARSIRLYLMFENAYDNWAKKLSPEERGSWRFYYRAGFRCKRFRYDFSKAVK